ncbi:sigma-70 family RNA polymerase sigma factor [Fulvivirga sp.]|uniref:RNA polymerase sigma factor n=1 Tax=Fulvivirga sp. TaxID=1931237 RepID=UPI0032EBF623
MKIDYSLDSENHLQHYLIERSQKGDRKAQGELYHLYVKNMYNICRRMMGNDDDASDVLQDAFVHAFSKLNKLNDKELFPGWLKRIVLNHCIDALRKRKQFEMFENKEVEDEGNENSDWSGYQIKRILKAMDNISVGYRTVLNLYVFEGYDHQEISEILNISTSTSRAQYSKAKEKIRQVLSINVN